MDNILDITLNLELLDDIKITKNVKGFIFTYNSINYIVTLHRYNPIKKITINNLINLEIDDNILQSSWNELLIIRNVFEDLNCYTKIKNTKIVIPHIDDELYCNNNKLIVIEYSYRNINHLPFYPRLLFIKVRSDKINNPGMPVFQKDGKLIGIITDTYYGNTYIMPIYYLIKTLQKKCNNKIYTINNDNIKKINKYNVIDNIIYHNLLSTKIPLDVYLTLEGDKNKIININKNQEYEFVELQTNVISNERFLLKENTNYIVNATLLIILKIINNRIIGDFINFVQLNFNKKILLNITKSNIINDMELLSLEILENNIIKKEIEINEILYIFTMFV